jgi:serine/threonine-protein kinase
MQLIEGKTLSELSKEMTLEEKIRVIKQIAEALHVAHTQGLIHRDIKPSNIMLERSDDGKWRPYILDFGLARDQEGPGLTRTGIAVGTPYYMAPEQVSGRHSIDRRTDVYGLGATLYELLSGKPPYQGSNGPEILVQIMRDDPAQIGSRVSKIPRDLETIVMKCLERDPLRRYGSAKELSEDLQRFLDGDPVSAKATTWRYRLTKRARKNRLATGILIAAAASTLVLIGAFLWVQWQNRLQANYAREFGDEVKNIQSVLPNIYTAPLHDVRPELQELKNRMAKMEARVKQGGRAARDPGNNALGQGYLALGEIEKAKEYLEKAWQEGYQLPSTAYALGQTMGLMFQQKLAEAERNSGESRRKTLKAQYEKEFRDPAVNYLKQAEGSVESPAYVEGLIALYEKRYDDALKKAKEAYEKSKWSYETKILEGKVLSGIAQKKLEAGDYKGAIQDYELAGKAYAQAADLGRSRADIYLSDCERWAKIMESQTYTDTPPTGSLDKAEEACNKAIVVNPDDPAGFLGKSYVYNRIARYLLYSSSEDPRTYVKKSAEAATEAEKRAPKNWEPYHSLLTSGMIGGEYELRHGIDPKKTIEEAIGQGKLSLKMRENNPDVLHNLGVAYALLAEYQAQIGENPIPTYELAIQNYQKIGKIDRTMNTGNEEGIAYWFMAVYQMDHGMDPTNSFRKSIEGYQKLLKEAPDDPYSLYNLGACYSSEANYEASIGTDPIPTFEKARECKLKASKSIPNNAYILNGIGSDASSIGEALAKQGKDPLAELNEARNFLKQASQIDPTYYYPYSNLGETELVNAQWAIKIEQSPVPYFDAARKAYQKSIVCNKEEPATYAQMADAYRWEADWQIQQKRSAAASIAKGFQWVEKSLTLNAKNSYAIATQGALFLMQARDEKNPAERSRHAATAIAALEKAIKMNPLLQNEYEPLLKEAKALQVQ